MPVSAVSRLLGPRWRRKLIAAAAVGVLVWVALFDSHSLLQRWQLYREREHLLEENARLHERIEQVEEELKQADSDEVVERVAREQYGMRREGETVHRVEEE